MMLSPINQLIIAAAGAGKTYTLVTNALLKKPERIMFTTYTDNNTDEIRRIFYHEYNCVPGHVTIKPWFTMLLEHFVRPYQGCLTEERVAGVNLVNTRSGRKFKTTKHPTYWSEGDIEKHYFDSRHNIYTDKISKFAFRCNEKTKGAVIKRFVSIFDSIYIDEAQDLAGYDLEIIKLLLNSNIEVKLVGDPRQVAYTTHVESKNHKYYGSNFADYFRLECKAKVIDVRDDLLSSSRRCIKEICVYADKLFPDFHPTSSDNHDLTDHDGVFFIRSEDVQSYLKSYDPMQLRWDNRVVVDVDHRVLSFGKSKGKSFDRVLIYPTEDMVKWIINNSNPLRGEARSKFYIGITRARHSVGIVIKQRQQKKILGNYWHPDSSTSINSGKSTENCNSTGIQLALWTDM